IRSNVQQTLPVLAFEVSATVPCSPIPESFAASEGCISAAPAVPVSAAVATSAATGSARAFMSSPLSTGTSRGSLSTLSSLFPAAYESVNSGVSLDYRRAASKVGRNQGGRKVGHVPTFAQDDLSGGDHRCHRALGRDRVGGDQALSGSGSPGEDEPHRRRLRGEPQLRQPLRSVGRRQRPREREREAGEP